MARLAVTRNEKDPDANVLSLVKSTTPPPLFSLGETNLLENTIRESGLLNISLGTGNSRRNFLSTAKVTLLREAIQNFSKAERAPAWTEIEQQRRQFERPNAFETPGEVLIGLGQSRATKQL
jgi:hypothetical protein